jgi:hypothetical protein
LSLEARDGETPRDWRKETEQRFDLRSAASGFGW